MHERKIIKQKRIFFFFLKLGWFAGHTSSIYFEIWIFKKKKKYLSNIKYFHKCHA